jgi:ABC-type lipoprotein release transport system permease subunit
MDSATAARARGLAAPHARATSDEIVVTMIASRPGGGASTLVLRGVDEGFADVRPGLEVVEGRPLRPGVDEVMVGRAAAGRFAGLAAGQELQLGRRRVPVVGVFAAGGSAAESEVWGSRALVAELSGRQGTSSALRVWLRSPAGLGALTASLAGYPELALEVSSERSLAGRQGRRVAVLVAGLGGFIGGLLALAAALGAAVTLHAQVAGRRREIAVLRALGFSRRAVLASFLGEGLLLAAAGGLLGLLAALALHGAGTSLVNLSSYTEVRVTLLATPATLLLAFALAAGLGLAGALVPALRAAAVPPGLGTRR